VPAKILRVVTPDDDITDLVTVRLTGNKVRCHYHSPELRREWEQIGIMAGGRTLKPGDGRPFYDALELAYSRSSVHKVEAIPDGAE